MAVGEEETVSIFVSAQLIRQDVVGRTRRAALSPVQSLSGAYTLITVCTYQIKSLLIYLKL